MTLLAIMANPSFPYKAKAYQKKLPHLKQSEMEFLPLEVQEHIGLYLPPNDYKQFWMSFRNSLPLKQRITLRTLLLSGQLEYPLSRQNGKCLKGLQMVGRDQLSQNSWKEFEREAWMHSCLGPSIRNQSICELYLNAIRMILIEIPAWFDTQRSFHLALQICCSLARSIWSNPC
jgi:hypothetical protein